LKPNDPYRGRTAPLTSKRCILYIYSTNIGTDYFKHGMCADLTVLAWSLLYCRQNEYFGEKYWRCIWNVSLHAGHNTVWARFYPYLNPLTLNDPYRGRTAPLTSKRCILYIYSTNIGTDYFKHGI